jgi:COMPASS component SWD3
MDEPRRVLTTRSRHSQREKSVTDRLMLATGSADNHAYLFDLGLRNEVTGELVQKLEGHTGRVYAVNFHPSEPLLASASADHSIKVRPSVSPTRLPPPSSSS